MRFGLYRGDQDRNGPPSPERDPRQLVRTFSALRHRNYRLFFAGQLISLTGTWMQQMALAWLVYQLTNSALLLGIIGGIGSLPMALFSLLGGVVADRVNKRRILLLTQSVMMLLAFLLAGLTGAGWIRAWQVAVLAALSGTTMAFDMPARQAFVVEMVGREDLMNAIALNSSIFNSARIIGPAIAGILVARLGPAWCFFVNGLSFLAVLVGLLLMRFQPQAARTRVPRDSGGLVGGSALRTYQPDGVGAVSSPRRLLDLRLVLQCAHADLRSRYPARRRPGPWPPHDLERSRRTGGRPPGGLSGRVSPPRTHSLWGRLPALGRGGRVRLLAHAPPLHGDIGRRGPGRRRRDVSRQHPDSDVRPGSHARARHGRMGIGERGLGSLRQPPGGNPGPVPDRSRGGGDWRGDHSGGNRGRGRRMGASP